MSVEAALAKAGLAEVPGSPASVGYDNTNRAVTESFPVTAGTAKVSTLTGHLDLAGKLLIVNFTNGKCVTFTSVVFDLFRDQITAVPNGSASPVVLFDTIGTRHAGTAGTTNTFTASAVQVHAAGASYLDAALGTSYFVAGQNAGSFSSSWQFTG
ncbi:hypothetical protein Raf01_80080 [Rugosimonospora africana]|uniref:Uncharacterized protein n=1 Tax=Rugosimonospora africana TaxID=556532 RepID=A0A8J3R4D4_9ACTN|nr:hypothetical protein Raf01_80080 [Rugosimonospora africana]